MNETSPDLRLLFWETTAGCNLECIHCRRLDLSRQLMKNDLAFEECRSLLQQIRKIGQPIVVLSGGEPLMRPDILDIAQEAQKLELPVALATNGTLIDGEIAKAICDSGIRRVAISLDGASATTHDSFRQQLGAFEAALQGFTRLKALEMSLQINCTVTQHNAKEIPSIYQMAVELGADALHFFLLVPVGCGLEIAESHQISAQEYEEILLWIYERSLENKIHLKATCAPHYFRVIRQQNRLRSASEPQAPPHEQHGNGAHGPNGHNLNALTRGCLAATAICFVSHTGEVFPCGYLPLSAGNVKEQPFSEIWSRSPLFAQFRDVNLLEGKCGDCEFKKVCMGCRARAYYTSGNFLSEEPLCVYKPKVLRGAA